MEILRSLMPVCYPLFLSRKMLCKAVGMAGADLRVLLYHDVSPDQFSLFSRQLKWVMKRWHFITPTEFEELTLGTQTLKQNSVLLTFDDGFASNRLAAEQVLHPLEIQAIFFVATDFIDQPDRASARQFICQRLQAGATPAQLPPTWSNMTWADIHALKQLGHTIGAHTASHERLNSKQMTSEMQAEIIQAADYLEAQLGSPVRHFAFPFGDFSSISAEAMALAATRFDFMYSGLRGSNSPTPQRYAIRRDSQTVHDSLYLLGGFLAGGSDWLYRKRNRVLDQWGQSIVANAASK